VRKIKPEKRSSEKEERCKRYY